VVSEHRIGVLGTLIEKAASAVMRQAAKPGVPGKESWSEGILNGSRVSNRLVAIQ
jgi:hypothetical protein